MSNRYPIRNTIGLLIIMLFALTACNLGASSNQPPTLVPRATHTPYPTLGMLPTNSTPLPPRPTADPDDRNPSLQSDIALYSLIDKVDIDRLMTHINMLQGFYTRHVNSPQDRPGYGIGAAAEYIMNQFEAIRAQSNGTFDTWTYEFTLEHNGVTTRQKNIIGWVRGTQIGAGTLVVGAHYDSVGQPFDDPNAFAPGANDNASGVSAIIELARIMSKQQPRASILFVAFSAEEIQDGVGSKEFAKWFRENVGEDAIGMINIDTIGSEESRDGLTINNREMRIFSSGPNESSISRQMARMMNFVNFNHGLPIDLVVEDSIDRQGRYGDHFHFDAIGYPAARIMQALEAKTNADPTDTVDGIDRLYYEQSVKSLLALINAIADGPRPPTNIQMVDKQNGLYELLWEPVSGASSYVIALRFPGALTYGQQFEVSDVSVEWDNFSLYEGVAIAVKDVSGILGPLSREYRTLQR